MDRHEVVIAVYDGVQLLDAAGPLEVFDGASRVRLGVEVALEEITELGTLVVAGGEGTCEAISDAELIGPCCWRRPGS
ncbi:hypothetical protein AB0L13_31610 [Saccharopolyspora shandongensis]|uniref:hypothetical protein n=1 Tax=Saccharopolyspora shandongensis TaxID=418495 RepID=UPI00344692DA